MIDPVLDCYLKHHKFSKTLTFCCDVNGLHYYFAKLHYLFRYSINIYDCYNYGDIVSYFIIVDGIFFGCCDSHDFDNVMNNCLNYLDHLVEENEKEIKLIKIS